MACACLIRSVVYVAIPALQAAGAYLQELLCIKQIRLVSFSKHTFFAGVLSRVLDAVSASPVTFEDLTLQALLVSCGAQTHAL